MFPIRNAKKPSSAEQKCRLGSVFCKYSVNKFCESCCIKRIGSANYSCLGRACCLASAGSANYKCPGRTLALLNTGSIRGFEKTIFDLSVSSGACMSLGKVDNKFINNCPWWTLVILDTGSISRLCLGKTNLDSSFSGGDCINLGKVYVYVHVFQNCLGRTLVILDIGSINTYLGKTHFDLSISCDACTNLGKVNDYDSAVSNCLGRTLVLLDKCKKIGMMCTKHINEPHEQMLSVEYRAISTLPSMLLGGGLSDASTDDASEDDSCMLEYKPDLPDEMRGTVYYRNENNEYLKSAVQRSHLSTLADRSWLCGEVLHSYLVILCAKKEKTVAIDPQIVHIHSIEDGFKHATYPNHDTQVFAPLHMMNKTHWGLVHLNINAQEITLYDSYAYQYDCSYARLDQSEKMALQRIWRSVTNKKLISVTVSRNVLVQTDGNNCGAFALYHAEVLLNNSSIGKRGGRMLSLEFLKSYREHISTTLQRFYDCSEDSSRHCLPTVFENNCDPRNVRVEFEIVSNGSNTLIQQQTSQHVSTSDKHLDALIQPKKQDSFSMGKLNDQLDDLSQTSTQQERFDTHHALVYLKYISATCPKKTYVFDIIDMTSRRVPTVSCDRAVVCEKILIPIKDEVGKLLLVTVEKNKSKIQGYIYDYRKRPIQRKFRTLLQNLCSSVGWRNSSLKTMEKSITSFVTIEDTAARICHWGKQYLFNFEKQQQPIAMNGYTDSIMSTLKQLDDSTKTALCLDECYCKEHKIKRLDKRPLDSRGSVMGVVPTPVSQMSSETPGKRVRVKVNTKVVEKIEKETKKIDLENSHASSDIEMMSEDEEDENMSYSIVDMQAEMDVQMSDEEIISQKDNDFNQFIPRCQTICSSGRVKCVLMNRKVFTDSSYINKCCMVDRNSEFDVIVMPLIDETIRGFAWYDTRHHKQTKKKAIVIVYVPQVVTLQTFDSTDRQAVINGLQRHGVDIDRIVLDVKTQCPVDTYQFMSFLLFALSKLADNDSNSIILSDFELGYGSYMDEISQYQAKETCGNLLNGNCYPHCHCSVADDQNVSDIVTVQQTKMSNFCIELLSILELFRINSLRKDTTIKLFSPYSVMEDNKYIHPCLIYSKENMYNLSVLPCTILDKGFTVCCLLIVDTRLGIKKLSATIYHDDYGGDYKLAITNGQRNTLKAVFARHGLKILKIASKSVKSEALDDIRATYFLSYIAYMVIMGEKIEPSQSTYDAFHQKYIAPQSFTDLKSCAHYATCVCADTVKQCKPLDSVDAGIASDTKQLAMYLLNLQKELSHVSRIVLISPLVYGKPAKIQKCAVWNTTTNNYNVAFIPLMIDEHLSLIVIDKRDKNSVAAVYCYGYGRATKKVIREHVKHLAEAHGCKNISVRFEEVSTMNHIKYTVDKHLLYIADSYIRNSGKVSLLDFLTSKSPSYLTAMKDLDGCVLKYECSCGADHTAAPKRIKRNAAHVNNYAHLPETDYSGPMDMRCQHCNAMNFHTETSSMCCQKGYVYVDENYLSSSCDPLIEDFKIEAVTDKKIYALLRPMNNMFACASNTFKMKKFPRGEQPLVLEGKYVATVCHLSKNIKEPAFAQIYLADDCKIFDEMTDSKEWRKHLPKDMYESLMKMFKSNNVLVQSYLMLHEHMEEEEKKRLIAGEDGHRPIMVMNIKANRNEIPDDVAKDVHRGRLNKPVFENQVAAIFICENGRMPTNEELGKGVRVFNRFRNTEISHVSENMDALCYPFLFPKGEQAYVRTEGIFIRANYMRENDNEAEEAVDTEENDKKDMVVDVTLDEDENMEVDDQKLDQAEAIDKDSNEIDDKDEVCEDEDEIAYFDEETSNSGTVSRRLFAIYILSRRYPRESWLIHRFLGWGRLTAQYIIHTWTRIEADRLSSIKTGTIQMRGCTRSALFKYLDEKLDTKGIKLGSLVTMPASFTGSNDWFRQQYSKSMVIAQRYGNPDLFITFTGNSKWKEITENLTNPNESWITDPMLCVRVFFLKLRSFLNDITKKKIFGIVMALQLSIEFQKRGMPHAHVVVTLKNKINTPEMIDKFVCAEIPVLPSKDDPSYEAAVKLRNLVVKHMIHNRCEGKDHYACRAADPKKCAKHFPKQYANYTSVATEGYPIYRRRDNGPFSPDGIKVITNEDVVPYNAYLLAKYDCHINVEVISTLLACKYMFKYIYKGPDMVVLEILDNDAELEKRAYEDKNGNTVVDIDMTQEYVNARYVSQAEAAWRISAFPLQLSLHSVTTLYAHLPGEQRVYFRAGEEIKEKEVVSPLMAYFALVAKDPYAAQLTWIEVAEQYTFDKKNKQYRKKKRSSKHIATIAIVSPKLLELYALRLLLVKRPGGHASFEAVRTVDGVEYDTFVEAAKVLGYIHEDKEWFNCMSIISHAGMPIEIRRMFVSLLLYCEVHDALSLWEAFKKEMRNRSKKYNADQLDQFSLRHIERLLYYQNATMKQFGLAHLLISNKNDTDDDELDLDDNGTNMINSQQKIVVLNEKQDQVMNTLLSSVNDTSYMRSRVFFLYGKAGCGKTFLYNQFIQRCHDEGKNVLAVASTGIASTMLIGGRTAHSAFRIPLNSDEKANIRIDTSSTWGAKLKNLDVILWDEAPMQSRYAMECVDRFMRDIASYERSKLPFGGVMVVFGGDWSQLLPVIRKKGDLKGDTLDATLKKSKLWDHVQELILDENMRVKADEIDHMEWLRKVGEGKCQTSDGTSIKLPMEMLMDNEQDIIEWMYTPEVLSDSTKLGKVALLSVRNADTLQLNELILDKMPGDDIILESIDTPVEEDDGIMGLPTETVEYLNKQTPSGMPPHRLRLKIGCIIMLQRNLDVAGGLCNGTRLEVLEVLELNGTKMIKCKHITSGRNQICYLQRMPLTYSEENTERTGLAFKRVQFPIRLSFSMTINKSQGQTFDKVGIIMRTPNFAHGATYVALSRCTSKEGIRVTTNNAVMAMACVPTTYIRNIVYTEILE